MTKTKSAIDKPKAKQWNPRKRKAAHTEFQTPPFVCNYMASMIPDWVKTVLEPTPGIGNLVKAVPDRCEVTAAEDFFTFNKKKRFDCVIMNPPFSPSSAFNLPTEFESKGLQLGYHIMNDCLNMTDNVIALMPWFTISDSDKRLRSIYRYGLKSVTALPRRTFQYMRMQTCILEMERGWNKPTLFHVLDCMNDDDQIQLF